MEILKKIQEYDTQKMKKYCIDTNIDELHNLKLYLDDLYYNTDLSEIHDGLYDILKDFLIKKDLSYIPPVGSKIRIDENRIKLPFWVGSVDKITPEEQKELDRWIYKNKCDTLIVSEKLDGVSGIFTSQDGKMNLYTRGDGETGADISYLIQYISSIPKVVNNIAIRGELIIKKNVFNTKYFDGKDDKKNCNERLYRNGRNMVSGLIGSKIVKSGLYDIDFVVYEIIGHETMEKPYEQLKKLKKMGFKTVSYEKINKTSCIQDFINLHSEFKKKSEYEIDGIVIQSNTSYDRNISGNPSYLFAFKVCSDDSIHETTVIDIEWSVSLWGQIIPVAIISPIKLTGNTIKRVTISNAGLMKSKGIGPGSIINVTRSKEVIPFIVSVSKKCDNFKWPDIEYEWDKNNVHLQVLNADDNIIKKMKVKRFTNFFLKIGVKHVSDSTITKMYENGFDTLLKIISANEKDLINIDGIQEKSAKRIITNIKKGLKGIKTHVLIGAYGIFGFGVGRKRVFALLKNIPDLLTTKRKGLKKRIMEVEGFSDIMADKVVDNIDCAVQFIDEISKYVSFVDETPVSNSLVGLKYVFSGFRSKELEKNIEDRGGKIVTSVSKKTSAIIVNNKETKSTKVDKSESLGISVYTKDEFIKKFII